MPLSRNQSKSAENLRCQRDLLMYLQLTRSVLRYLIVKITNKFVGINTPRICFPGYILLVMVPISTFAVCRSKNLNTMYIYQSVRTPGFVYEWSLVKEVSVLWYAFRITPMNNRVCLASRHLPDTSIFAVDFGANTAELCVCVCGINLLVTQ